MSPVCKFVATIREQPVCIILATNATCFFAYPFFFFFGHCAFEAGPIPVAYLDFRIKPFTSRDH